MNNNNLRKELENFFDEMSREEVKKFFTDLGFEVEDDIKGINYTDTHNNFEYTVDKEEKYRLNQTSNIKVKSNNTQQFRVNYKFVAW